MKTFCHHCDHSSGSLRQVVLRRVRVSTALFEHPAHETALVRRFAGGPDQAIKTLKDFIFLELTYLVLAVNASACFISYYLFAVALHFVSK